MQVFNFDRQTDFELWDLERQYPSDMSPSLTMKGCPVGVCMFRSFPECLSHF